MAWARYLKYLASTDVHLRMLILACAAGQVLSCASRSDRPVQNLLAEAQVSGFAVAGDPAVLTRSLPPEGSAATSGDVVWFRDGSSVLTVDLGRFAKLSGCLVQADYRSRFQVSVSKDGDSWEVVWSVPEAYSGIGIPNMGLQSRLFSFAERKSARYVRLSSDIRTERTTNGALLSRLVLVEGDDDSWKSAVDYSRFLRPLVPWMDLTRQTMLYIFLSAAALVVVTWLLASGARRIEPELSRVQRVATWIFIIVALIAWPNFMNFNWGTFYHPHDFSHYYLGGKYAPEISYTHLYGCSVIAVAETGFYRVPSQIRDLETNRLMSSSAWLQDADECRSRFSETRWEDFKRDVEWFRERSPDDSTWEQFLLDHGFNAPPSWLVLGRPLASIAPVSEFSATALASLDFVLLLLCGWIFYRVFGLVPLLIAASFFCLNPIAIYRYTGGSLLRFDWLLALCLGVTSFRRRQGFFAGFFTMYSSLLRIFPGIVLLGLGVRAAAECLSERSMQPLARYRKVAAGALMCGLIVVPLSLVAAGDVSAWSAFRDNTEKHLENMSVNRVGLGPLIEAQLGASSEGGQAPGEARRGTLGLSSRAFRGLVGIGVLFGVWAVTRRRDLWVTAVLSIAAIPFFVDLSSYYFVVLALFAALWGVLPVAAYGLTVLGWISWLPMGLGTTQAAEYRAASFLVLVFVVVILISGTAFSARRRS